MSKFGSESELGKWQKILHLLMPRNCCLNRSKYHQKDYNLTTASSRLLGRINIPKSSETAEDLAIRKL